MFERLMRITVVVLLACFGLAAVREAAVTVSKDPDFCTLMVRWDPEFHVPIYQCTAVNCDCVPEKAPCKNTDFMDGGGNYVSCACCDIIDYENNVCLVKHYFPTGGYVCESTSCQLSCWWEVGNAAWKVACYCGLLWPV